MIIYIYTPIIMYIYIYYYMIHNTHIIKDLVVQLEAGLRFPPNVQEW